MWDRVYSFSRYSLNFNLLTMYILKKEPFEGSFSIIYGLGVLSGREGAVAASSLMLFRHLRHCCPPRKSVPPLFLPRGIGLLFISYTSPVSHLQLSGYSGYTMHRSLSDFISSSSTFPLQV